MGYNSKFYGEAEAEIKARKQKNALLTENRRNEFANSCPEYKELRRRLADTGKKLYQIFFNNNLNISDEVKKLEAENLLITSRIEELLLEKGLSRDYLDDIHTCKKCGDSGIYSNSRCDCFKDAVKRLAAAELNKNSQIKLTDFGSFDLSYYPDETDEKSKGLNVRRVMKHNLEFCKSYAEDFHIPCGGILMQGRTGLGKTHLSLAIADMVLSNGYSAVYGSVPMLFRKIEQEHFGRTAEEPTELLLTGADLLILDDLGTEFTTPFYTSAFYGLLNTRLNSGLPTIINTNLEFTEIKQRYGDHITSRLLTMEQLIFMGNDIRAQKKFGQKK